MDWYFEYEYIKKCCWFNYRRSGRVTIWKCSIWSKHNGL